MKKEVVRLLINGGILTLLTSPIIFENINLVKNNEIKFKKIDYSKEELYSSENIIIEPKNVELTTSMYTLSSYIALIKEYCEIFGLNNELVLDKIVEYTDNFNSEAFIDNNQIYDYGIEFENKEQAIIYFIKDIDMNYSKHGFDESIFVSNDYIPTLECEEMVEKYSEIFGIDKKIPMSVIYTESHYTLSSYNFNVRNNPGGMGHTYFRNLEVGIIYQVTNLRYNYSSCGLDSITFFRNAQSKHCPDNDGSWITFNENYYEILNEDYYYYMNQRIDNNKKVLVK